ncbi:MAG: aminotransferase class I/II-fold pyridoxal phosphate-dependent enzyme [Eubacterium sp.]|nr:aminotransferase class I/II-fold pyridoxal phosphate-dependent enzyme [Eubacterium sp.]
MQEFADFKPEQTLTPLIDAIKAYQDEEPAFFRIPGHRFERGADRQAVKLLGDLAYRADLTEAEGLDDLHQPTGAILQAEKLAADLYGSDRCWFLVNGTTCGNEAMILAMARPGDKILLPRSAHKSCLCGLILSGAVPVWMEPVYYPDFGFYGEVRPEEVEEKLKEHPDARGVLLTSPTYYGVISDIRRIAAITHEKKIPLCVDEAHGAHLYFSDKLPQGALACGADLVCQSTHKTVGSFTQSSMLHLKGNLIDPARVDECLKLVMSTSPNYLLMASLDGARHLMATSGKRLAEQALELADYAGVRLNRIPGIHVFRQEGQDPLRVVFSVKELGISGYRMQEELYRTGRVSMELADPDSVVAVITWGNTKEDIDRLANAVAELSQKFMRGGENKAEQACPGLSGAYHVPAMRLTPRQAFYADRERTPWINAAGKTAAESLIPYPPGIPLICPGEILTEELLERIRNLKEMGVEIHGPADESLETILTVKE